MPVMSAGILRASDVSRNVRFNDVHRNMMTLAEIGAFH